MVELEKLHNNLKKKKNNPLELFFLYILNVRLHISKFYQTAPPAP